MGGRADGRMGGLNARAPFARHHSLSQIGMSLSYQNINLTATVLATMRMAVVEHFWSLRFTRLMEETPEKAKTRLFACAARAQRALQDGLCVLFPRPLDDSRAANRVLTNTYLFDAKVISDEQDVGNFVDGILHGTAMTLASKGISPLSFNVVSSRRDLADEKWVFDVAIGYCAT